MAKRGSGRRDRRPLCRPCCARSPRAYQARSARKPTPGRRRIPPSHNYLLVCRSGRDRTGPRQRPGGRVQHIARTGGRSTYGRSTIHARRVWAGPLRPPPRRRDLPPHVATAAFASPSTFATDQRSWSWLAVSRTHHEHANPVRLGGCPVSAPDAWAYALHGGTEVVGGDGEG